MKITPDFEGRDDEFDDDTVRYYERIDDDYFYELYVLIDGEKATISITEDGVSVDQNGECTHTNIIPRSIFGEKESLSWPKLRHILRIVEKTGLEGKTYTAEEMDALEKKWENDG